MNKKFIPLVKNISFLKDLFFLGNQDRGDIVPVDDIRLDGHAIIPEH